MTEISGISGSSAIPPSNELKTQDLQKLAKNFREEIDTLILQLTNMSPNSPKNPKEVQDFAATINNLHANAMKATGDICPGCTSSNLGR